MDEDKVYFRRDIFRVLWMTVLLLALIGVMYWLDAQYEVLAGAGEQFANTNF